MATLYSPEVIPPSCILLRMTKSMFVGLTSSTVPSAKANIVPTLTTPTLSRVMTLDSRIVVGGCLAKIAVETFMNEVSWGLSNWIPIGESVIKS